MTEEWRDVVGFEGLYQVSDLGRVRSLDKVVCSLRGGRYCVHVPGRVMKAGAHYKGHLLIDLYRDRKKHKFYVHRLVADAFMPNPEGKPIVNHKDGVKTNNALANLEWATDSENCRHYHDCIKEEAPF